MPEPLKNKYTLSFITQLASEISLHYSKFSQQAFIEAIFNSEWEQKELKQRMRHIAITLHDFLPNDYPQAITILKPVSEKFSGFEAMFFPDFVACYGLHDFENSMNALAHFTLFSSAEFAIRAFIQRYPELTLAIMREWTQSDNEHLRRLASEGCRPRLPWATALPEFKHNPQPVIEILERLKQDSSLYVRRSVANNLNDISKDHPDMILALAEQWLGQYSQTDWIVKHACRSLLKQAHPQALSLFGFSPPECQITQFVMPEQVKLGEKLPFNFQISTTKSSLGKLRLEYRIHFMKANGQQRGKVFKISESQYQKPSKNITRCYSFKKITTRQYYLGSHRLDIMVNGVVLFSQAFELIA